MWSILENVPCALEKKVHSSAFGWNALKISMRSISSNVSFKTCVSLLIFCFDDLPIGMSGVLKSPTIIVLLSISPFMSVSVCHVLSTWSEVKCSAVKSLIRVWLFVTPWTIAYQAPSMGFSRQLEWVAISFSRGSSWPRNWTRVSRIAGRHFIWLPLGLIPWSLCNVLPYLL